MRFKKLNESLSNIAYMIRNDGAVFEGIKSDFIIHPYIFDRGTNIINAVTLDKKSFIWYFNHTANSHIKQAIVNLFKYWFNYQSNIFDASQIDDEIKNIILNKSVTSTTSQELVNDYVDIQESFNQEFMKVRFGGEFGGKTEYGSIYFRISSVGFNWFNIIWNFIYGHKNSIKDITIETDVESGKPYKIYSKGKYKFDHIDTETFLMLRSNPVIENFHNYRNNYYNKIIENFKSGVLPIDCMVGNPENKQKLYTLLQKSYEI